MKMDRPLADQIDSGSNALQYDVVVIGGGGSGLAAAVEAASLGRSVALLEKNDQLGGSTARSVGSISATNTPHQLRNGIRDCPQDHLEDLRRFNQKLGLPENEALSRLLVENVTETMRWLMSMGIEFFGPMKELPHRKPRMHNVLPNSRAYIYYLQKRARHLGVDIRTSTRARQLIVEDGRVVGVRCDGSQGSTEFRAVGGVVLTSGDYSASEEKRAKYISPAMAKVQPVNPANTGDGHDMVLALGGRILNPHLHLSGIRFQAPPSKWVTSLPPNRLLTKFMNFALGSLPSALLHPFVMSFLTTVLVPSPRMFQNGAVLVNRLGERFVDELGDPGPSLAQQPDQLAFIVLDGKLVEKFSGWPNYVSTAPGFAYASLADYRRNRKDIFHEASTVAGLAASIGAEPAAMEKALAEYNRIVVGGARAPLDRPPYVALGPVRYFINFTDGGVAVNDRLQVLGADNLPIAGLYAAGFTGMGGVLLEGHGHHLGWAFTSGRFAGRHAAYNVVTADIPEAATATPALD